MFDALALWVKKTVPKGFFRNCDEKIPKDLLHDNVIDVPASYREIIQAVSAHPQYTDAAKREFRTVADSWLIAYARAHNMTIVTHENDARDSKKRVFIPVVCREFEIPVVTCFEMLLDLKIKFVQQVDCCS